jgi:hypothetical protein
MFITTCSVCSTVIFIRTPDYSLNWSSYLAPFKWQLWGAIVAAMFLLAVGLHIVCYFGNVYGNRKSQQCPLFYTLYCVLASFCGQGKKFRRIWTGFNIFSFYQHRIKYSFNNRPVYEIKLVYTISSLAYIYEQNNVLFCLNARTKLEVKYFRKLKSCLSIPLTQM